MAPDTTGAIFFIINWHRQKIISTNSGPDVDNRIAEFYSESFFCLKPPRKSKRKLAVKIMFRMPRNLRKSIILALLFSVIFPWTLMAEAVRQAPKNSLSYFLESEETAKEANAQPQVAQAPQIIKTPEKINAEPQPLPGFEVAPPEPAPEERIDRFAAVEAIRAKLSASEANGQPQTKDSVPQEIVAPKKVHESKPETVEPAKIETPAPAITEVQAAPAVEPEQIKVPAPETEKLAAATEEYVPFAGVLARMQQNKDKRAAEAQKLGVVLPSQGGDIATVSPSLSKMHQTIRDIMNR